LSENKSNEAMTLIRLKFIVLTCMLFCGFNALLFGQNTAADIKAKVDAIVSAAYQSASASFPCKLGAVQDKTKMLSWQDIDKCLNYANDRVNWGELVLQIRKIREAGGYPVMDLTSAIESSLAAHAIPYNKIFRVKETAALLPLSNSLLKFLPAGSLMDLPVFNHSGARIGTFSGVYILEKEGVLSGTIQRHSLFQYTGPSGNIQSSPSSLLLDSYGVVWKDVQSQPGFQLPSEKLILDSGYRIPDKNRKSGI
jgi:hypothetical protein